MTLLEVNDAQIAEWRSAGHPYKVIAAEIAEWALEQDRGTPLPGNDCFARNLPITASATPWKRAKVLLESIGVLYRNDGLYQVA